MPDTPPQNRAQEYDDAAASDLLDESLMATRFNIFYGHMQ